MATEEIITNEQVHLRVHLHHKVVLGIAQQLAAKIRRGKLRFTELGVWRGKLSHLIAREIPNARLLCVDRWGPPPPAKALRHKDVGDRMSLRPEEIQRGALLETQKRLEFAKDRVEIVVGETDEVGKTREANTVDLQFHDAAHYYEQLLLDCKTWWPVLAPGGIMAGHDLDGKYPGVGQAVRKFAKKQNLPLWKLDGSIWMMYKPPDNGLLFPEFNQRQIAL